LNTLKYTEKELFLKRINQSRHLAVNLIRVKSFIDL